jgi:hypothetical protein
MRSIATLAFGLLFVVGCGGSRPVSPPPEPALVGESAEAAPVQVENQGVIVTPDDSMSGKVALVNPNAKFVVVSFPIGALPPSGKVMNAYRNGLKVGEIKITGPQRDFDTVADIVSGSSQVGDEIREN